MKSRTLVSILILIMAVLVITGSCASMKLVNYEAVNPKVLYETDFSQDDGMFDFYLRGEILEIKDGVMHLKGKPDGTAAHAYFKIPFGRNSITSLKFKISKYGPEGFLNFLSGGHDLNTRIAIIMRRSSFGVFAWVNGKSVYNKFYSNKSLAPGKWHDITVSIQNDTLKLFINGRSSLNAPLDEKLPLKGYLNLECHKEMWIDDLKVVEVDTFEVPK